MLWYKAWLESRLRFAVSACTLAGFCILVVLSEREERGTGVLAYARYVWIGVYRDYGRDLFIFFVLFLGLGGLLRERAHGTSSFTLALPVSRLRLLLVRFGCGLLEIALLALVPAIVIPVCSSLIHESYQFSQAVQFSVIWACCGAVVFASSFLLSTILSGEYSAPTVAFIALFAYVLILNVPSLRPLSYMDLFSVMNGEGMPYFNRDTCLLIGKLPWPVLSVDVLISLGLLVVAGGIVRTQDF